MKPELTESQERVLRYIDELLKYAESCGMTMQRLALTASQFRELKTVARKKASYPDQFKELDIGNDLYRGVQVYQLQEKKVLNQQQLSLREA